MSLLASPPASSLQPLSWTRDLPGEPVRPTLSLDLCPNQNQTGAQVF